MKVAKNCDTSYKIQISCKSLHSSKYQHETNVLGYRDDQSKKTLRETCTVLSKQIIFIRARFTYVSAPVQQSGGAPLGYIFVSR